MERAHFGSNFETATSQTVTRAVEEAGCSNGSMRSPGSQHLKKKKDADFDGRTPHPARCKEQAGLKVPHRWVAPFEVFEGLEGAYM